MAMARTKKAGKPLYCVIRLGWRFMTDRHFDRLRDVVEDKAVPAAAGRPIAVFTDRAVAQSKRDELEREARATVNPFVFVEPYWLHDYSSLSEEELQQALKRLHPEARRPRKAKYSGYDWLGWWESNVDQMSPEQIDKVWQLLDRVHFYEVVQTSLAET
jgi:hypothetical protein